MQGLLRRACADNGFAVDFVDSAFGEFFIREMVNNTEWVLSRNGLPPTAPLVTLSHRRARTPSPPLFILCIDSIGRVPRNI
jgi:hypothetical protein